MSNGDGMNNSYDRSASTVKVALSVGETFENEFWRIHQFSGSIRLTHLANAGKRGGRCVQWAIMGDLGTGEALSEELVQWAKRGADFNKMKQVLEAKEKLGVELDEIILKGVDVKPGNFQKLFIRGVHITVEADYDSYSISDIDDDYNDPTCIAKGKQSVFQFYRWAKDNAKALQTMTLGEAMNAMKAAGIKYHYFCAVD